MDRCFTVNFNSLLNLLYKIKIKMFWKKFQLLNICIAYKLSYEYWLVQLEYLLLLWGMCLLLFSMSQKKYINSETNRITYYQFRDTFRCAGRKSTSLGYGDPKTPYHIVWYKKIQIHNLQMTFRRWRNLESSFHQAHSISRHARTDEVTCSLPHGCLLRSSTWWNCSMR